MKKTIQISTVALTLFLTVESASGQGFNWKNHSFPFDFLFGNHIDTHQESIVTFRGRLFGFFYIGFTGERTDQGVRVATHADCAQVGEECRLGWVLHGIPVRATLLDHQTGQHPTWYVDPADMPRQRGFTHFHWFGPPEHADGLVIGDTYDGMLLKLTAIRTFFFKHHGGFLVTPGIDYETHANVVSDLPSQTDPWQRFLTEFINRIWQN